LLQDLVRNAMKRLGIILMALLLSGCATLENFWDEEVLSPYLPGVQADKQKNILVEGLNHWLGQPKSERIRVAGPPQGCVTFNTIGESCEWKSPWVERGAASSTHQSRATGSETQYQYIAFTDDRSGIAKSWGYRRPYGQFTNSDYQLTKTQRPSSRRLATAQELEWVHPTKAREAFSQDYYQCQEDMKRDSLGQQGARFLVQDAIERCVKEKGWVQKAQQ